MTDPRLLSLPLSASGAFICQRDLNLFDQSDCQSLATQTASGRYLRFTDQQETNAILVEQCEDGYRAWLPLDALIYLAPAPHAYQAIAVSRAEIETCLDGVISYCLQAKERANVYQWGGNIGPDFDCSGLMQAAFAFQGIWLPRDSYQQAAFCQTVVDGRSCSDRDNVDPVEIEQALAPLVPGDLLFFGSRRVDHVGLYLGNGQYIHSSGKSRGRNGIGIDSLVNLSDPISHAYFQTWWYGGRVMESFDPRRHSLATTNISVNTDLLK